MPAPSRPPPRRFAQLRRVLDREGDVPNDDVVAAGSDGSVDYRGCTLNAARSDADDIAHVIAAEDAVVVGRVIVASPDGELNSLDVVLIDAVGL